MATPTLGKILIFTNENGEVFPAIVVKVNDDSTVNLQVFEDSNSIRYINSYQGGN